MTDGPIARALSILRQAADREGGAVVMFSGGKDSLVTLSLAVQVFERVTACHLYFVRGLHFIEGHLERVCAMHRVELMYQPHPSLAQWIRRRLYVPQQYDLEAVRPIRHRDVERHARVLAGAGWTVDGQRAEDSLHRRVALRTNGAIEERFHRVHPIHDWREADVYAYLRRKRIPLPARQGDGRMSGFSLGGRSLLELKSRFPDDFQRVLEVFPFAEAAVFREELLRRRAADAAADGGEGESLPGIRDEEAAPAPDRGRTL